MKKGELIDLETAREELERLPMQALRERFAVYYRHTPQTRNKAHFISKILWAIQRDAYGDISDNTRTKALTIANDRDVRERFPKPQPIHSNQSMSIAYKPDTGMTTGTILTRIYNGREIRVTVLDHGFESEGKWFKSLSAIAREVTGTQWNGKLFFKLK